MPDFQRQAPEGHRFVQLWQYESAAGDLMAIVTRYEDANGRKTIRPWRWMNRRWTPKALPNNRPLWNLPAIADPLTAGHMVVVVEGEKCAEVLRNAFGRTRTPAIATTWMGGASAIDKTDWSPLAGRKVFLWPDNDEPGFKAAGQIADKLRDLNCDLSFIVPDEDQPRGWDCADGLAEDGFSLSAYSKAHRKPVLPVRNWRGDRAEEIVERAELVTEDEIASQMADAPAPALTGIEVMVAHNPTQDAVALAFTSRFGNNLRYTKLWGAWHHWNGKQWEKEETGLVADYIRRLSRAANERGMKSMATAGFYDGVERIARTDRAHSVLPTIWDNDTMLLNTPAGTVNLRDGTMREHRQDDHITKMTRVSPSSRGGERFRRFLEEVFVHEDGHTPDPSLREFAQVSLGACLSGALSNHWLLFWVGEGRNGKSVLGDRVLNILGDYAKKIPARTLMQSRGMGDRHLTELASLMGARLCVSSEAEAGDFWAESRVKELTGDAYIAARFMRQDEFQFRRTHKHLVFANVRPQLRSVDQAMRSRMKIIHWHASFADNPDRTLESVLDSDEEAPYILHWLIEGHIKWIENGEELPHCAAVDAATRDYMDSQSTPQTWINERIVRVTDPDRTLGSWPTARELYNDYRDWKAERGEQPISMTRWADAMRQFEKRKACDGFRYLGVRLNTGNTPVSSGRRAAED
jgi:putative DNA primase/helicase